MFSPRGVGRTDYQAWCKFCMSAYSTARTGAEVRKRRGLPFDTPSLRGVYNNALPLGTERTHRGYVLVKVERHHRADRWGWVFKHILEAERKYGITVTRDYTIHHVNGDRSDNRAENLDLRWGNHGKGADVLPALLRDRRMRDIAREILRQYPD